MGTYNIELPVPMHLWTEAGRFASEVHRHGGSIVCALRNAPWVTVELPDEAVPMLTRPGVLSVEQDHPCCNCQPMAAIEAPAGPAVSWASSMVEAPRAHEVTRGAGARVAIIDTGIVQHQELAGARIVAAECFVPNSSTEDRHGHGTAVTGLVVGQGMRLQGIAPEADILILKALGSDGEGMWSWVAAAVDRAIDYRADVVCMAMGGEDESIMLEDTLHRLALSGAIAITPSGNSGEPWLDYPARTGWPLVITAVGKNGRTPGWANHGPWPHSPDAAAPGVDVPVLSRLGGYQVMSGTSMATGIAAGCMALLYASAPGLRQALEHALAPDPKDGGRQAPAAVSNAHGQLEQSAVPLPESRNDVGYGLIDAARLVGRTDGQVSQAGIDGYLPLTIVAGLGILVPYLLRNRRGTPKR